jgi:hypothetical protein
MNSRVAGRRESHRLRHDKTATDGSPQCSLPVTDAAALVETVKAGRQVSIP